MIRTLCLCLALAALAPAALAQSFDEILRDTEEASGNARRAFLQPLADASGLLASSGTYFTGKSHGLVGFDIGLRIPTVMLASGDQLGILDEDVTPVSALAVPILVANKGLPKGFQVGARAMKLELSKDVGDLTLYGASLRWEANEVFHIPFVMPRMALQANWSQVKVGESLTTDGLTFDLIVSKKLAILEPYGGYSTGTLNSVFEYEFVPVEGQPGTPIKEELDASVGRLSLGLNVTPLPTLRVNAEYGMGDFNTLTFGLILSVL